jgi:hypothetical protein
MGCAPSEMEEFNATNPTATSGAATRGTGAPSAGATARPTVNVAPGVHIMTPHELALRQGRANQPHAKCASSAAIPAASPRSADIDDMFGTIGECGPVDEEQPFSGDAWQATQKGKEAQNQQQPLELDAVSVSTGSSATSTRSNSPSPGASIAHGESPAPISSDDLDSVFGVQGEPGSGAGGAPAGASAGAASAAARDPAAAAKELLEEAADIRARAEFAASRMLALVQLFPVSEDGSDPHAQLHARLRVAAQVRKGVQHVWRDASLSSTAFRTRGAANLTIR